MSTPFPSSLRLVMLDRDGVLNEDRPDSVKNIEEFVMIPRAAAAVEVLNKAGLKTAVITNQSAIGKGWLTEEGLREIHKHMDEHLKKENARLDLILHAPDHPDQPSERRKPEAGMLLEALAHFEVKPEEAIMVGDAVRDLEAAQKCGVMPVLVRTGKGAKTLEKGLPSGLEKTPVYDDLWQLAQDLLGSR